MQMPLMYLHSAQVLLGDSMNTKLHPCDPPREPFGEVLTMVVMLCAQPYWQINDVNSYYDGAHELQCYSIWKTLVSCEGSFIGIVAALHEIILLHYRLHILCAASLFACSGSLSRHPAREVI